MAIETPCVRVCTLDPALRICIGCGRDLAEIERWSQYSPHERTQVMGRARQRLALFSRTPKA
jgi:predicted Fe-S protein YdhL (DUF1289 family)